MSVASHIFPVKHADDSMVPVTAQESISSIMGERVVVRLVQEPEISWTRNLRQL